MCCTHSIKSALEFKKQNPETNVYILYRDIRTYGEREDLYRRAREQGVLFFRYDPDEKPQATAMGKHVAVTFKDHILDRWLSVKADLLCLAAAIVTRGDTGLCPAFQGSS